MSSWYLGSYFKGTACHTFDEDHRRLASSGSPEGCLPLGLAYVESMTRKKNEDLEKMRKRAEAKKKRKGQQKTKRVRAKRLYEMDRDGSNFIVQ